MKPAKCVVCRKKNAVTDRMCEGCLAIKQRIYGGETNMAKKTATKKNGAARATEQIHESLASVPDALSDELAEEALEEEAVVDLPHDVERLAAEMRAEQTTTFTGGSSATIGVSGEDEPDDDDDDAPSSGPVERASSGITNPKTAIKRVKNAIARLHRIEWERFGISEGPRAIATLKLALPKLEAVRPAKATPKSLEGQVTRVRDKERGRYDGILEAGDLDALKVLSLRKGTAVCTTPSGEKIMIPTRHIEIAAEAAQ